jgi:hypothetical protein
MRCNVCHGSVVFERTVFRGTAPTTIRLCQPCADKVDVHTHVEAIKNAGDHAEKDAAVAGLIAAVETAGQGSDATAS